MKQHPFDQIILTVLAAVLGTITQNTSPLTAAELRIDPALCTVTDGVYEISTTTPETIRFYSQPFDVVPGGLYRFKMNACWFGEGKGCFPAGVDKLTTDYNPTGSEEPNIPCARMIRLGDDRKEACLTVGRWESTKTIRFTEPSFAPACPLYKIIRSKKNNEPGVPACADSFLPLGAGERIEGTRYSFYSFTGGEDGNFTRTLDYANAEFNTNRWCFEKGKSIVYRFDLRPKKSGSTLDEAEPIRFISAETSVEIGYHSEGNCLVEMSADGQNWYLVGSADKTGVITGSAEELFNSPIETLYLRCRADDTDQVSFQIYGIALRAELDTDRFSGEGETIYAEYAARADADKRFEVTPLYFERGDIYCRVTNTTGGALTWPAFPYTAETDGQEPVTCRAAVARADNGGADLAAGESALFAIDLSQHPVGKNFIEVTCRFDREYRIYQKIPPYFVQDYTHPLETNGASQAFDLLWCEADRKVPLSPWSIIPQEPAPIAIAAPRNDFESFQVVVQPKENLANISAESSDLTGPDGAVISKENIRVRWGYYHFVDHPTDGTCARGWYVDALIPMTVGSTGEIGAPLPVAAGANQPIFVTVYVPLGIPKGDYTGNLTITAAGKDNTTCQVPYQLTVWDFDQPVKNRFETAYGFSLGNAFTYQNISDNSDKRAVWEKYLKDASDHRISFYDSTPMDGFSVSFDTQNLTANFDFTAFDAEMTRVMDKYNVTNFIVPVQGIGWGTYEARSAGSLAGFSSETPEYDKLMRDYMGKLQEHLRQKGWLDKGYVYWFDEPEEKDYDFVSGGFGTLKKYAPDLPRMLTEEPSDKFCAALDDAGGNIDIWCPISNCFSMPEARGRMAKGERFWWYVCTGPKAPYCTEFTDHPAHELRVWHWQAFERDITGSLIWTTNYWTSTNAFPDSYQDPYVDPMCYQVGYGLPRGEKRFWGNGDGRLFYPPLAAAVPGRREGKAIIEDPVDSIRLEELREGIEDYEILLTLRERYEAKKDTLTQEERERIEKLFDFSDITTDMIHFTNNPAVILDHRARAAEAIEWLSSDISE